MMETDSQRIWVQAKRRLEAGKMAGLREKKSS
jgi:hypothetical protein